METKEEFLKNIKEFISKNRFGLKVIGAFGIFLCIGIPIIINFIYLIGESHTLFITAWGAADVLSYYGTILGATATIVAVTMTIKHTRIATEETLESAKKDRQLSENNSLRQIGLQICFELLDVMNYPITTKIFFNRNINFSVLSDANSCNNEIMCELCDFQDRQSVAFLKFFEFHPNLTKKQEVMIMERQKKLTEFISELKEVYSEHESEEELDEKLRKHIEKINNTKDLAIEFQSSVTQFNKIIREVIHYYDYVI